ncbi:NTPCR [Symbiodinium natans]|uniref:NTPCR protein n=1 Tax=Symbiodinium natans TaxID=878477 RepID=A0A812GUP8_9DINO|nr:NTPCR [Symbiodinium natans]
MQQFTGLKLFDADALSNFPRYCTDIYIIKRFLAGRLAAGMNGKAPPTVGKYTVDVGAFEGFALPALEPPKEEKFQLPENARLFKLPDGAEKVVSLLYEPTDEEEGANSRIRLEFGEVLNVPPSSLREVPEGWKPEDEEEDEEPVPRLCVVDEVGKMGLLSVQFPKTLARVLEIDTVLATGVQSAKGQRDPEAVEDIKKRPGARVVKLTRGNRDAVVDQTYAFLRESLGLGPPGTGKPKPRRVDKKKQKEEERRAKEQAEREAREREEKEREEAAEREKAARTALEGLVRFDSDLESLLVGAVGMSVSEPAFDEVLGSRKERQLVWN